MQNIMAVDPGTFESAYVLIDVNTRYIYDKAKIDNKDVLRKLQDLNSNNVHLVVEQIKSYGNAMGDSLIETCVWTGRFLQVWGSNYTLIPRKAVAAHICHNSRAGDSNIRQAIIDSYGGNLKLLRGTQKKPGPLHGVTYDIWSALALALTYIEQSEEKLGGMLV